MAAKLQRPGCRQHEHRGMGIDHRLGEPDGSETEQAARDHQRELQQDHHQCQPRHGAAKRRGDAVNAVGDRCHMRKTHGADDGTKAGLLLIVGACPNTTTSTTTITIIPSFRKPNCAYAPWKTVLTEKGYVDPAALDLLIETYEKKVGPRNGARVVAKAWADPAYRARLMKDATPAIAEIGYAGRPGEKRAFALTLAMGMPGGWNIDMSRFARENRPPAEYLSMSYYQIWFAALE